MKLLENFKRQLDSCGEIQRVWLTSFNIDIEFIETFLLPAVLGVDQPRTRMDYEVLQQVLSERNIDFRVFCDKRYIGPDQNKRTLISVHGVSLAKWGSVSHTMGFTDESLFHAKVIYIEGKNGRVLGAGSANLTLSGWGRNREVFQFVPVNEKLLYQSMRDFFRNLFDNINEDCPLPNLRSFSEESSRVRFSHSFQDEAFLNQLLGEHKHQALAIWSPYLSKDLARLIHNLKEDYKQPELSVHLVADLAEGQYLRTSWTESLEKQLNESVLTLYQFPGMHDDRIESTHAKLWKTRTHLAIGSWNCTKPGANAVKKDKKRWLENVNAEAGLIFKDTAKIGDYLGPALEENARFFASDEQLKEDALDVPKTLPFDLQVIFDWASLKYKLTGVWNDNACDMNSYSIRLPALDRMIPLVWKPRLKLLEVTQLIVADPSKLLANHRYEVFKNKECCGTGLLIEISTACRRAQQYDDLKSLFDAMVMEGPEPSVDDVSYRVFDGEDNSVYLDENSLTEQANSKIDSPDISYFRLFSASYQYATRLRGAKSLRTLEQWVFTRPGCLEELVDKTQSQISTEKPVLFHWFLAKEVNGLCHLARQLQLSEPYKNENETIASDRWKKLKILVPKLPVEADAKYVELLVKEYTRMSRSWGSV